MYWEWKPYVPVAKRRAKAARAAKQLAKKRGRELQPITIDGRKIATTFWGAAWCDSLEDHSDYANRLPRGRTYVRNGSVIDLEINRGQVNALVSGSEIYKVRVDIATLKAAHWKQLKSDCAESIDSLLDLLSGRLSDGVMQRLTHSERGLFPQPNEIKMSCSCPDWAGLCKHLAAVLYGVGARLDREPQLLFLLRGVDHAELVSQAVADANLETALGGAGDALAGADLGAMFGIELDASSAAETPAKATRGRRRAATNGAAPKAKSAGKKKTASKSATVVVVEKPTARQDAPCASAKTKVAAIAETSAASKKKSARRPRTATV